MPPRVFLFDGCPVIACSFCPSAPALPCPGSSKWSGISCIYFFVRAAIWSIAAGMPTCNHGMNCRRFALRLAFRFGFFFFLLLQLFSCKPFVALSKLVSRDLLSKSNQHNMCLPDTECNVSAAKRFCLRAQAATIDMVPIGLFWLSYLFKHQRKGFSHGGPDPYNQLSLFLCSENFEVDSTDLRLAIHKLIEFWTSDWNVMFGSMICSMSWLSHRQRPRRLTDVGAVGQLPTAWGDLTWAP